MFNSILHQNIRTNSTNSCCYTSGMLFHLVQLIKHVLSMPISLVLAPFKYHPLLSFLPLPLRPPSLTPTPLTPLSPTPTNPPTPLTPYCIQSIHVIDKTQSAPSVSRAHQPLISLSGGDSVFQTPARVRPIYVTYLH